MGQKLVENAKNWKIQMRHFGWFSNYVRCQVKLLARILKEFWHFFRLASGLKEHQPASIQKVCKSGWKLKKISFFTFLKACVMLMSSLLSQAILLESPSRQLSLGDIYKWFTTNFKYFRTTSNLTWKVNQIINQIILLHTNSLRCIAKKSLPYFYVFLSIQSEHCGKIGIFVQKVGLELFENISIDILGI